MKSIKGLDMSITKIMRKLIMFQSLCTLWNNEYKDSASNDPLKDHYELLKTALELTRALPPGQGKIQLKELIELSAKDIIRNMYESDSRAVEDNNATEFENLEREVVLFISYECGNCEQSFAVTEDLNSPKCPKCSSSDVNLS